MKALFSYEDQGGYLYVREKIFYLYIIQVRDRLYNKKSNFLEYLILRQCFFF